jgi:hypothetical protein
MRDWGFFEWLAYAVMFVAAIIMAVDQGLKLSPDLLTYFSWLVSSNYWAFSPLVLILLATGILVSRGMGWIGEPKQRIGATSFVNEPPRFVIANKRFINERITLDGIAYRNCRFENVTFVFNGTSPFALDGACIFGRIQVASDNPVVEGTMIWLRGLGIIGENVEFTGFTGPSGLRVQSPVKKS